MRFLTETRILAVDEVRRAGARRWLRLTLSGLAEEARPGRTVLFAEDNRPGPRCHIATVETLSRGSAILVAKFEADDRVPESGASLTVWSNETPAVAIGPGALIVTTRPFLYRIAPYAQVGASILVEAAGSDLWEDLRRRVKDEGIRWPSVFLALEPARIEEFKAAFPDANPYLYANMDMSCGIGACRSCHVNLRDNKDGEASCRLGPWFALDRVDLVRLRFASAPFI